MGCKSSFFGVEMFSLINVFSVSGKYFGGTGMIRGLTFVDVGFC
jgi:hypothetical protein